MLFYILGAQFLHCSICELNQIRFVLQTHFLNIVYLGHFFRVGSVHQIPDFILEVGDFFRALCSTLTITFFALVFLLIIRSLWLDDLHSLTS